jgi:hypothetical protein
MRYLGEDELTDMMGIGYLGEVRRGPDGRLYQWVAGYDGLGNPVGFWKALTRVVRRALPAAAAFIPGGPWARAGLKLLRQRPVQRLLRRALPYAAPFIPGGSLVSAGLTLVPQRPPRRRRVRRLRRVRPARMAGLGALYQAPDGALYRLDGLSEEEALYGLAEDEELYGLAEDEELYGLAEDEELYGLAEDDELEGLAEDEELYGLAEDEELEGFAEDEELYGLAEDDELYGFAQDDDLLGQGYIREDGVSGLDAFVPDKPMGTRWFTPPATPPELWRPLW